MSTTSRHTSDNGWAWSQDWEIPSDTTAGRTVLDLLLERLQEHGWQEDDVFGVHLSVEEALVNAIKHGNRYDPDKCVAISCWVSPSRMRIKIRDQGEGFDPADVPDPTADENLEMPSGRGLMLMRNFMTEVKFCERGNSVHMEKHRSNGD